MKYINLTAHDLVRFKNPHDFIYDNSIKSYVPKERNFKITTDNAEIWPSSGVVRCKTIEKSIPSPDHIPYLEISFDEIINLPDPVKGVTYVVSNPVATAAIKLNRDDLVIPTKLVRNYSGQILGCLAFGKVR